MSKPSRRPNREEIKAARKKKKKIEKQLRQENTAAGLKKISRPTISNRKSIYSSVEEERSGRNDAVAEQVRIIRSQLPTLLKRLSKIKDPRNPQKVVHKISVLMIYGILTFVFQMSSCREANRKLTRPMFWENLKFLFPEIETLPHHDTLKRLLATIDVNEIERAHVALLRKMIRKKKFLRYLIANCYPIAIDGTGKFSRNRLWDEECLERKTGKEDNLQVRYHVYVLEANLVFRNGMSIPLISEFLSYIEGDTGNDKQDCELKAFYRLVPRLKKEFPALKIMIILDGLYANGPVIELCRKNKWQFMIVLKDDALPSVMSEFETLAGLELKNRHNRTWGNRRQKFKWINDIEYFFGPNDKKSQILHVVECRETWQEVGEDGELVEKKSRHVWLSSEPLDTQNLHERCNLGARFRWGIESGILVEKHHGYRYEHCFSYNWQAMKGYHYLMRMGHMLNIFVRYSKYLVKIISETGVRGLIDFIRETIANPWLDYEQLRERLKAPFQLRLV